MAYAGSLLLAGPVVRKRFLDSIMRFCLSAAAASSIFGKRFPCCAGRNPRGGSWCRVSAAWMCPVNGCGKGPVCPAGLAGWTGDDYCSGRRFGFGKPRSGRMGLVRERRLLARRRMAARHQQPGRADGRPGSVPVPRHTFPRRTCGSFATASTSSIRSPSGCRAGSAKAGARPTASRSSTWICSRRWTGSSPAGNTPSNGSRGHAGHDLNEAADERARAAATAYQQGVAARSGPGFRGRRTMHRHAAGVPKTADPSP